MDKLMKMKAELEERENKGFTLMEMLIVVAIIAVLIAIAIPVFTGQLENARDTTTVANLRSAYAQAQAAYLTETPGNSDISIGKTGGKVTAVAVSNVVAEGTQSGYGNASKELPFTAPDGMGGTPGKYTVTFSYDANGSIGSVTAAS